MSRSWWLIGVLAGCSSGSQHVPSDASSEGPCCDAGGEQSDAHVPPRDAASGDAATADGGEHDAGPAQMCRKAKAGVKVGTIQAAELGEASGIVASRSQPGVLWLHNDSGDVPRLFALAQDGALLGELAIEGAKANDWEDIAMGSGPVEGKSYLYIADIGDNEKKRDDVQIYRVQEPAFTAEGKPASTQASAVRIDVTYDDGDAHDAETLLFDPIGADLYIVGKAGLFDIGAQVPVFRIAAAELAGTTATAKRVGMVPLGPATGGDILPDGSGIAIRNYTGVRYWAREPGESVAAALARPPCPLPLSEGFAAQGEALAFTPDGLAYLTTTEGASAPIFRYDFE